MACGKDGYVSFAETVSRSWPGGFALWYLDTGCILILCLKNKQILPDCYSRALNLVKWILSVATGKQEGEKIRYPKLKRWDTPRKS